jgi:hypothetical protein
MAPRVSSADHAHVIRFSGSIDLGGYKWERREPSTPLPGQGTIFDQELGGQYIVSCGGVRQDYTLEARRGVTVKRYPHKEHFRERCFPMLELANAGLCEPKEKDAAMEFVRKFGTPNGYHEIELEEFLRLAFTYLNVLSDSQRSGSMSLTVDPSPRDVKYIDADGQVSASAKTFIGFCHLELMELVRLGREFKQCEFCNKWYALARQSGKGRGRHSGRELRFCNYGSCRQKSAATKA